VETLNKQLIYLAHLLLLLKYNQDFLLSLLHLPLMSSYLHILLLLFPNWHKHYLYFLLLQLLLENKLNQIGNLLPLLHLLHLLQRKLKLQKSMLPLLHLHPHRNL
jgi:hypothetical protein